MKKNIKILVITLACYLPMEVLGQEPQSVVPTKVLTWLLEEEDRGDILKKQNVILDSLYNSALVRVGHWRSISERYKEDSVIYAVRFNHQEVLTNNYRLKAKREREEHRKTKLKFAVIQAAQVLILLLLL